MAVKDKPLLSISTRLSEENIRRLEEISNESGITKVRLINNAVEEYLKNFKSPLEKMMDKKPAKEK